MEDKVLMEDKEGRAPQTTTMRGTYWIGKVIQVII